jgi:hypothetical protein
MLGTRVPDHVGHGLDRDQAVPPCSDDQSDDERQCRRPDPPGRQAFAKRRSSTTLRTLYSRRLSSCWRGREQLDSRTETSCDLVRSDTEWE